MSLPKYPPTRTHALHPAPEFEKLRLHDPVSRVVLPKGETAWLVTRYSDVCAVLRDRRFGSDSELPGFATLNTQHTSRQPYVSRLDGARHGRVRRAFTGEFRAEPMARLRPEVIAVVDSQLDRMLAMTPPVDLIPVFALPVPSLTICRLLGIPPEDRTLLEERGATVGARTSTDGEYHRAEAELLDYAERLVADNEHEPRDTMVGRIVTTHLRAGTITREELTAQIRVLMVAGHVTTSNMIALGVVSLLQEPARLGTVARRPALIGSVVDELLRYHTVTQDGTVRMATADVEIGGTLIRAGERVVVSLAAANRDGALFPDPDTLDLDRRRQPHVAFGHGPHRCLGAPLARLELEIALFTLATRVPTLRLAVPVEEIEFRAEAYMHGLREVPVTW